MASQEHLDILRSGVKAWNAWRKENAKLLPDLGSAKLRSARLSEVDLSRGTLTRANLLNAQLTGANMCGADLRGADLSGANLGAANLKDSDLNGVDLQGADLRCANLNGADLTGAKVVGANLSEADLRRTRLSAYLHRATLRGANLDAANLRHADLSSANLSCTNLIYANLSYADVSGARFDEARFGSTMLGGLDLSTAVDLDQAKHFFPSAIGLDTIYRSKGKIPESFLRGCGVPDGFITYMRSLTGAAFEFYSCFISYSTRDQKFADRLYADLQAKGVRCWFAPHDIRGVRKIHEQIDEPIRVYDKLLLILSEDSMNSAWVKTEIANARTREEQQKRQMLFPITMAPYERIKQWKLFDDDIGIDSARVIREYLIPDFSNWKDHDQYQKALDRLLQDLKAETERAAAQS
jgi:uncharacterized protein YjbI with pentapeptide repeats